MHFSYIPYIVPLMIAGVISAWVAYYAWSHRTVSGAAALALLASAVFDWALAYALEIAGADLSTKVFWAKVEYLGTASIPLLWLIFCYNYFRPDRPLKPRVIAALWIVPLITILLVFTTESHGLIWSRYYISRANDFSSLGVEHGFWFWVYWGYAYILLMAGAYFIIRLIRHKHGLYRGQIAALIFAAVAPWAGNLLYVLKLTPITNLDLTPFGFTVAIISIAWGIFRFQLINLVPLARDTVVEEMEDGILVLDSQGQVADVNRAAAAMLGLSIQQVVGRQATDIFQRWPHLTKKYGEVLDAFDEISIDERWFELRLSPLRNKKKIIIGRLLTLRDITAKRQAEERLRLQNKYLSILHEITMDLLNRRDLDDLLQAIVDRAADLLDATYGEILLKEEEYLVARSFTSNQDFLRGDRVARGEAKLSWQAHDTLQPATINDYATWTDRRVIYDQLPLHAVASFPVIAGNQCVAVLGVGRSQPGQVFTPEEIQTGILFSQLVGLVLDSVNLYDSAMQEIARRKRTTLLLQASEERYRQIVENANDIIYRTDATGRFTYMNPTGLHMMGFSDEVEIIGKYYLELVVPFMRQELQQSLKNQLLNRTMNTYQEFIALTADGRELWIGQNVQLILSDNEVSGFQAVARDITQLKQAQEAIALSRDQALEASQLKTQLLSRVSHELRTPLSSVLGYAELFNAGSYGALDEEQKIIMKRISDSARYLSAIINDLLDEAQISSRNITLHNEFFSPSTLLEGVRARTTVLAQNKSLFLNSEIDPGLPEKLYGDEKRLQQIIINLVGNAIKFTQRGGVQICLSAHDSSRWAIQVTDTGSGIPEEDQRYIFDAFRQVNNAITRENRGIGLGLSIVKQLVEIMDGSIQLVSKVGEGSTFTIILPILTPRETLK